MRGSSNLVVAVGSVVDLEEGSLSFPVYSIYCNVEGGRVDGIEGLNKLFGTY